MVKEEGVSAYFDFETYNIADFDFENREIKELNKTAKTDRPIGVYAAGLAIDNKVYTFFGLDALDKFGVCLKEKAGKRKITLTAHNCSYDFACLNGFWHNNGYSKIEKINAAQTDDERHGLGAEVKIDGLNIIFKDTGIGDKNCGLSGYSDILPVGDNKPVKGKLIDYEKGNLFEKENRIFFYNGEGKLKELDYETEKNYLINDVKLLPEVRKYIFETKKTILKSDFIPEEIDGICDFRVVNRKITKASFAKTAFELCIGDFFHNTYKTPIDKAFYHLQLKSYIGGFTAGNKFITKLDLEEPKIKSYDVNSLYPFVMSGYLPGKDITREKPKGSYCTGYKIFGTKCKYKKKYEFLDCNIISTVFERGMLNNEGLENSFQKPCFLILKDYYEIILEFTDNDFEVLDAFYQETTDILASHIKRAYELRVLVKEERKDLADSIKLFLNSGYGKFGEKTHQHLCIGNEEKKVGEMQDSKDKDNYTNLLTGLYICSMARIHLMKALKTEIENGNTFLYCDTDSLKILENNTPKIKIDQNELGAFKFEGCFTGGRYPLKRKRYYSWNKYLPENDKNKFKFACGGFAKSILYDLNHEERLDFFDSEKNVIIKGGKRCQYQGSILNTFLNKRGKVKSPTVDLNRYGLIKIFNIDISTQNKYDKGDKLIIFNHDKQKGIMTNP